MVRQRYAQYRRYRRRGFNRREASVAVAWWITGSEILRRLHLSNLERGGRP